MTSGLSTDHCPIFKRMAGPQVGPKPFETLAVSQKDTGFLPRSGHSFHLLLPGPTQQLPFRYSGRWPQTHPYPLSSNILTEGNFIEGGFCEVQLINCPRYSKVNPRTGQDQYEYRHLYWSPKIYFSLNGMEAKSTHYFFFFP